MKNIFSEALPVEIERLYELEKLIKNEINKNILKIETETDLILTCISHCKNDNEIYITLFKLGKDYNLRNIMQEQFFKIHSK